MHKHFDISASTSLKANNDAKISLQFYTFVAFASYFLISLTFKGFLSRTHVINKMSSFVPTKVWV